MLTPPEREAALFSLVIEKPLGERVAFLQAACGSDSALRLRLEVLLSAHQQFDAQLATPAAAEGPTIKLDPADTPDDGGRRSAAPSCSSASAKAGDCLL